MAAPDPSFIVTDPPPLNSTTFPYAVQPFPAKDLVQNGLIKVLARYPEAARTKPEDSHRFEG